MNAINLGIRNAFRNATRSISLIVILGLAIGLSLVMLIAHQAVGQKINQVKSSVGNTISISPAGFSNFSDVNNALSTSQLGKVSSLGHVTALTESLDGRLTTIGSSTPSFGGQSDQNSNNTTSLTSPTKLNSTGVSSGGGAAFRSFGGGGSLPSNFSLPITVLGTTDPSQLNGSSLTITSGSALDGSKDTDNAMVSTNMTSKNNLKVGSTFQAYGTTLTVAGIYNSGTTSGNDTVILALSTMQRLSDQSGDVTSATATVDSLDNLASTTSAVKSALGSSADVESSQAEADNTVKPLQNIQSVSLYSLIGAVVAGSIIILLTMIMIVRERRREIGILKAIGGSNTRIMFQFMSEALTLTILGAIIGLIIGVIGGNPVTNTLVSNSTNTTTTQSATAGAGRGGFGGGFRNGGGAGGGAPVIRRAVGLGNVGGNLRNVKAEIGWSLPAYGLGAAVLIAILGSGSAGWLIARVRPSEVMRLE